MKPWQVALSTVLSVVVWAAFLFAVCLLAGCASTPRAAGVARAVTPSPQMVYTVTVQDGPTGKPLKAEVKVGTGAWLTTDGCGWLQVRSPASTVEVSIRVKGRNTVTLYEVRPPALEVVLW